MIVVCDNIWLFPNLGFWQSNQHLLNTNQNFAGIESSNYRLTIYHFSRIFLKLYKVGNAFNKGLHKEEQNKFNQKIVPS